VNALQTYTVGAEEAGERLDKFLVRRDASLGRRGARWLLEGGHVRVDGRRSAKSQRLSAGALVEVFAQWGASPDPEPGAPLDVRLVRDDLVVVEKPAGQPTAPLGDGEPGSLAAALLGHFPEMAAVGYRPREPGLLHRLDTRTSGLVVAARTPSAFECLRRALEQHHLDKRYLAIVEAGGVPDTGVIERPLMPHPSGSGRVIVAPEGPPPSGVQLCRSSFITRSRHGRWALLEVVAPRAYRHQVRVHLAASGWPIAGDTEYGGAPELSGRHALHASHVAWAGDDRVPGFSVDSDLPPDLWALLREGVATAGSLEPSTSTSS
jgi:23S rRNA pseudouridine1911/1915/1917 synthase